MLLFALAQHGQQSPDWKLWRSQKGGSGASTLQPTAVRIAVGVDDSPREPAHRPEPVAGGVGRDGGVSRDEWSSSYTVYMPSHA